MKCSKIVHMPEGLVFLSSRMKLFERSIYYLLIDRVNKWRRNEVEGIAIGDGQTSFVLEGLIEIGHQKNRFISKQNIIRFSTAKLGSGEDEFLIIHFLGGRTFCFTDKFLRYFDTSIFVELDMLEIIPLNSTFARRIYEWVCFRKDSFSMPFDDFIRLMEGRRDKLRLAHSYFSSIRLACDEINAAKLRYGVVPQFSRDYGKYSVFFLVSKKTGKN